MFELLIKRYLEQEDQLKDDLHSLFYVMLGQCDKAIMAKLELIDGYATQAAQGNCLWILQHVRATMNQFDLGQYPYVALFQDHWCFYNLSQGRKTVAEYYHAFQTEYNTIGLLHGWPPPDLELDAGVQPGATGKSNADTQAAIHRREVATCFILGTDKSHFGKLQCDLQDNFARETNQFPMTLTTAYNLLLTTKTAIGTTLDMDAPDDRSCYQHHFGHGCPG